MLPNPILPGFHPDPSVLRDDDGFLLATSTFAYFPGLQLYRSTDLQSWRHIGSAVDRIEQLPGLVDAHDSGGLYAPTLRLHDGVYYLACTLMVRGRPEQNFYLTATDPAGPWSDAVVLDGARGMDPDIFFDDGRVWWSGCREKTDAAYGGDTEIWTRELDLSTGRLVGEEHVLWTTALRGAVWGEGPHLYRRGGWYYLVTAEGGTSRNHAVVVARAPAVTGPYVGHRRNPVLTHRHLGPDVEVQDVGHADLVDDADGRTWLVCLATRLRGGRHVLGRETFLAAVDWVDGWPVVNPGLGRLGDPTEHPAHPPLAAGDATLTIRAADGFAVPTETGGWTLRGRADEFDGRGRPAALLRRVTSWRERVGLSLAVRGEGRAGLVLRQNDRWLVQLEVVVSDEDAWVTAVVRRDGVDEELARQQLCGDQPVRLEAQMGEDVVRLLVGDRSRGDGRPAELAQVDAGVLSTETAGGFVGAVAGPYALGDAVTAVVEEWTTTTAPSGST